MFNMYLIYFFLYIFDLYFIYIEDIFYIYLIYILYRPSWVGQGYQTLELGQARSAAAWLRINYTKYQHPTIKHYLNEHFGKYKIWDNINKAYNKLHNIDEISDMFNYSLTPRLKIDRTMINKMINDLLKQQKLVFKYEYEKFNMKMVVEIMKYIGKQDKDWCFNKKELAYIYHTLFKEKYSPKMIQTIITRSGHRYVNK